MILLLILLVALLISVMIIIPTVITGGLAFIIVFGDAIVAIAVIVWLIKKIFKRKK